jgi:molybdate transport system substrate-binding protein
MKITFLFTLIFCSLNALASKTIYLSIASSLKNDFTPILDNLNKQSSKYKYYANFGATNILLGQIKLGAPVDILIAASSKVKSQLKAKSTDHLFYNSLVLVKNKNSKELKRISFANPKTAPLGEYTYKYLNDLETNYFAGAEVIHANSAIQNLYYIESGEVDYGIVYKTDFIRSKNLIQLNEIKLKQAPVYEALLLTKNKDAYNLLLENLKHNKSKFEKKGYVFRDE